MKKHILPFRLNNTWLGIDLESVVLVESCGNISIIPNSQAPLAGLMQKNGKISPIWSLYSVINSSNSHIKQCPLYIELSTPQHPTIIIPVDEVQSVVNISTGWININKYGLQLYRYLDKKTPTVSNEIEMLDDSEPYQQFEQEITNSNYHVEEFFS